MDKNSKLINDIQNAVNANGSNFTQEEVSDFVNMGHKFAAKAVLTLIKETLKYISDKKHINDKHVSDIYNLIDAQMPKESGQITIAIDEMPVTLHISLAIGPKDYVTSISIPNVSYQQKLFEYYNFLKQLAMAYWLSWKDRYPEIMNKINSLTDAINHLQMDQQTKTSLYFVEDCPKRITLFCFYYDSHEKTFYYK